MIVLGVRLEPRKARYALVEYDGAVFSLLNAEDETRLVLPPAISESAEKIDWLYRELERIFHSHPDIQKVCIKTNEFTQSDSKSKRETAYLEGAVLLFCQQRGIPVNIRTYSSIGTKSGDVKQHAESRVGRTKKYWDGKIADAIMAAWKGALD